MTVVKNESDFLNSERRSSLNSITNFIVGQTKHLKRDKYGRKLINLIENFGHFKDIFRSLKQKKIDFTSN